MTSLLGQISSLQSSLASRREHADMNRQLARVEKEIATGLRADLFRDIGQRGSEAVRLRHQISRNEGFVASNKLLLGRMEITDLALSDIRQTADDYLALAISGSNPGTAISRELQASARAAFDQVAAQANSRYLGGHLFGGTMQDKVPMQDWNTVNPDTGESPASVLAGIVTSVPTTVAEADAIIAEIDAIFEGTHPDPDANFESTFYNGATAASGTRVEGRIDEGVEIAHGIQANDDGFRELFKGLAMLATVDVSQIEDRETYTRYMEAAVEAISAGSSLLLGAQSRLGSMQALVEDTIVMQEDVIDVYSYRIVDIEAVDPYEAASRMELLTTQLEASYAVTARLSRLSILNYLI